MIEMLVNLDVEDLERAIAFYRAALGLRLGRRLFDGTVAEMLGAATPIYLLETAAAGPAYAGASHPRDYGRHWTPVHLDFVVDEITAAVRTAEAAGARLEGDIRTHGWGRIATLSDPFGHGFCLLQFVGRGYDENS